MQLFATFEHHSHLEMAISQLEKNHISNEQIYAIPLDNRQEAPQSLNKIQQADGFSLIDIGMMLGTAFSVIGVSIGFQFALGPIWVGLISAGVGFWIGVAIYLWIQKIDAKGRRLNNKRPSEVILIVDCTKIQGELVEYILWGHFARGVAKMDECSK